MEHEFGRSSVSQRRGIISLLPKEDAELLLLQNWRPITLLNVDYKIASKAIGRRIEPSTLKTCTSGPHWLHKKKIYWRKCEINK